MSAKVIDVSLLKPVLEEFGIRGELTAIRGSECRLECRTAKVLVYRALLEQKFGYELLSVNDLPRSAHSVLWFRVTAEGR